MAKGKVLLLISPFDHLHRLFHPPKKSVIHYSLALCGSILGMIALGLSISKFYDFSYTRQAIAGINSGKHKMRGKRN
jgi:hypothetical protein